VNPVEERERVVEQLEQILVVLDHLALHVHTQPLLVHVTLIAVEQVRDRQVALRDESRQEHRALKAQRDRLEVGIAESPTRNTGVTANGWSLDPTARH
jgi:cytidylate kinase